MELRRFKHDVKNHFISMEGLLNTGNTEELKAYFKELHETSLPSQNMYISRNDVIDAIMHYELNHRCNKNVAISVHGTLPEITSVSSIDICTLFSNLLSNAISAVNKCSDTPWLEITFSAGQKFFLIEISNDVDEIIPPKKKNTDRNHGHGVSKIKAIINKYDDNYEITLDKNRVKVSVFLPI